MKSTVVEMKSPQVLHHPRAMRTKKHIEGISTVNNLAHQTENTKDEVLIEALESAKQAVAIIVLIETTDLDQVKAEDFKTALILAEEKMRSAKDSIERFFDFR